MKAAMNGIQIPTSAVLFLKIKYNVSPKRLPFGGRRPSFYYTSAHIRLPRTDGSVMTRTCRIRPGPEQRSSANQSSSIIRRECENPLRRAHIHARAHTLVQEIASVADCWVTGVQTEEESGNYSFPLLPSFSSFFLFF